MTAHAPVEKSRPPAEAPPELSVGAQVMTARQQLRAAGLATDMAELDARLLAQHVLGWTTERFLMDVKATAPEGFAAKYEELVRRRGAREPLAYIVGHREFWGLDIEVTPAVLVPRPETEFLIESVLAHFSDRSAPVAIVDVCTGSGCVAVALACERPSATLVATDISEPALAVAQRNAERHGVDRRVQLVRADLLGGIAGPFDAIVANPPYVPYCDRPSLASEVAHQEPALAIFAGEDGMAVITQLVPQAATLLREGGMLMFEFGFGQSDIVADLIEATAGLTLVGLRRDLQGIPRIAIARRDQTND